MTAVFSVLSIVWGLIILIIFSPKLKNKDLKEYKEKGGDVDDGFPLLVISNWILRKTPIVFIKGVVLTIGLVFIGIGLALV
ncbi:hypothetical protein EV207_10713 [Scopulibacillus darangshiensis]|uniref:Uncharacterized protein n=1 Tax=Scopulibacillus darangshiensis TaxID=442528 RepID=A0A4R2P509_9BACL|nr:hypothetical protein [Scopulibacillus darangshiensis]TCP29919.1 hypothetical protein EV207_10713 [Scopulibacillus darangshiensis]